MKIVDAFRKRGSSAATPAGEGGCPDPIPGYDRLGHRAIGLKLKELSQVALPDAAASAKENAGREGKAARVRASTR